MRTFPHSAGVFSFQSSLKIRPRLYPTLLCVIDGAFWSFDDETSPVFSGLLIII